MLRRGVVLCLLLLILSWYHRMPVVAEERGKPNFIFFLADDLGWTGLSAFGSDLYETPHLDHLANEGLMLTHAYAACTVCSPSRASILTGKYPARLRLTSFIPGQDRPFARMSIPDWTRGLEEELNTLPEVLLANGYRTFHVGKWHLAFPDDPDAGATSHGFEFSLDKPGGMRGFHLTEKWREILGTDQTYLTDYLAEVAENKIREVAGSPFFLYFAFHVPHTPIQGREDLVAEFQAKVNPAATHRNPTYAAMVKSMDLAVGRLISALEDEGLADNTVIIFTSDNGGLTQRYGKHDGFTENLPLRRGKGSGYEGGVRVPAIVHWPSGIEAGGRSEVPVMTIDWMPTILDLAGVKKNVPVVDGQSLLPILTGRSGFPERDLFWHFPHYHAGGDGPYSAIRSGDWKLIERHETGRLELFDLAGDPGESENRADGDPGMAQELRGRLGDWKSKVNAQMPKPNPDYDPERAQEVKRNRKKR